MVTLRQDTPEFRQSAVNLVLVEGLSARKAAKILPSPFTPFTVGLRVLVAELVV
jgi:transposase